MKILVLGIFFVFSSAAFGQNVVAVNSFNKTYTEIESKNEESITTNSSKDSGPNRKLYIRLRRATKEMKAEDKARRLYPNW